MTAIAVFMKFTTRLGTVLFVYRASRLIALLRILVGPYRTLEVLLLWDHIHEVLLLQVLMDYHFEPWNLIFSHLHCLAGTITLNNQTTSLSSLKLNDKNEK